MNLSKKQKEVISSIKLGYKFMTSEGEDWKSWLILDNDESTRITINRRTATTMFDKGLIIADENVGVNLSYKLR